MKKLSLILVAFLTFQGLQAQISAKMMRYADLSSEQLAFVYGGDIWVMPKAGGPAMQLTHSPGEESWPRFSPDGSSIAFTASYNGNEDVYVMPVSGGLPTRITYHSGRDRMVDWHPDGKRLLFASGRESGQRRLSQFYLVSKEGGMPEKLPVPYGELASFSSDGSSLAYITKITENYPFKRYRGGLSSDVYIYDLEEKEVVNITDSHAIDGKPAWVGEELFFLSDRGEHMRLNVWSYDSRSGELTQHTHLVDFDVSYLSGSDSELVFEAGGVLYLMDASSKEYKALEVQVSSDLSLEMPRKVKVDKDIRNVSASPEGKRIVFEARGELFNVPVEEGYVLNLTRSSGAFDMFPAWSPDGKYIAFWSDMSGEYELYLQDPDMKEAPRQLSHRGKGFGYRLFWSPDGKHIAYLDETNTIYIIGTEGGESTQVDSSDWNIGHGGRHNYSLSWSPDSKWLAYVKALENSYNAIFLYNLTDQQSHQVTSGFYDDSQPLFSEDGAYLYFMTDRNLQAMYSDMGDGTWIYPNSTQLAVIPLTEDGKSLLHARNDELKEEKAENEKEDKEKESKKEDKKGKKDEKEEGKEEVKPVKIDLEDMEARIDILPPKAGNIRSLASFKGKLVFLRRPNSGSASRSSSLVFYDLEKREEKTIMGDVDQVSLTADGKMMLVRSKGKYGIIKAAENQKVDKPIPTGELAMNLVPREEWKQIFDDTWRRYRDFFYDPQMHGVDWDELRIRYGSLVEDARSRWDLNNISANLLAELSAGHTYTYGSAVDRVERVSSGYLGVDWELEDGHYRISRIVRPASWDTEIRSPLDKPGVDVKEGDLVLAVNGKKLDPGTDPYAAFEGLDGKTVILQTRRGEEEKSAVIRCLTPGEEAQLRYLEWIETNRRQVDELSGGKLGYIYMSNTASRGQLELVRMFYGQLEKQGFIIDERFNGGGQLADRFLELLQRPVVYNLHWRHGRDHTHPTMTNTGPMGMLINGWAGSGGDGLPWAFQELEAGPIVGERTLGILVGPATGHRLIDGGGITVPGARLYDNDGHWFWEGAGVAPDIEVWDDPNILMQGRDPQIERVVKEVLELLESHPPKMTPAPEREDRTASDLGGS